MTAADGDSDDVRLGSCVRVVQWPDVINVRFLPGREDWKGVRSSFYPAAGTFLFLDRTEQKHHQSGITPERRLRL